MGILISLGLLIMGLHDMAYRTSLLFFSQAEFRENLASSYSLHGTAAVIQGKGITALGMGLHFAVFKSLYQSKFPVFQNIPIILNLFSLSLIFAAHILF